jgi:hypothetical protein
MNNDMISQVEIGLQIVARVGSLEAFFMVEISDLHF